MLNDIIYKLHNGYTGNIKLEVQVYCFYNTMLLLNKTTKTKVRKTKTFKKKDSRW